MSGHDPGDDNKENEGASILGKHEREESFEDLRSSKRTRRQPEKKPLAKRGRDEPSFVEIFESEETEQKRPKFRKKPVNRKRVMAEPLLMQVEEGSTSGNKSNVGTLTTCGRQEPDKGEQKVPEWLEEMAEIPEPKWFYAVAGKYEPSDDTGAVATVWIDLLDIDWFESQDGLDRVEYHRVNRQTPIFELVIDAPYRSENGVPTAYLELPDKKFVVEEGSWFKARVAFEETFGAVEGELWRDRVNDGETVWLIDCEEAGDQKERLEDVFSIREEDSTGQHAVSMSTRVEFIGAFDIGQGNCNALYNADGHPFLYFDFGLGPHTGGFYRTRPANFTPCLAGNPTVILSHFDADHRELAEQYPAAFDLPWVVIDNKPVTSDKNFFNNLTHVRVWPRNRLCFEEYPWGFLLRSHRQGANLKTDKNDIGLVALIRIQEDSNAPAVGQRRALDAAGRRPELFPDERYVLLTGDAMFQYVASCEENDLDGLVCGILAAHHGAQDELEADTIPLASPPVNGVPPVVAFSYGIFHSASGKLKVGMHGYAKNGGHGHPFPEAVKKYRLRGYHHLLKTAEDLDVTVLNTAGEVIVHHPRHGRATGDAVTTTNAVHGAYNVAAQQITVLDDDHYTIPVARDGTLRIEAGATVRAEFDVTEFDRGNTLWCFVRKPGHGLITGNNATIANATNNGVQAVRALDADYFVVQLGVNANQIDPNATVGGAAAVIYHVATGSSLILHPGHGYRAGSAPQITLAGAGPNPVVVLDADHYVWPASANPGNPTMNTRLAGARVTIFGLDTGHALVRQRGHGLLNGTQVKIVKISGSPYPAGAPDLTVTRATADYYTVDRSYALDSSEDMRVHVAGVVATRRNLLMRWKPVGGAPVGAAAAATDLAAAGFTAAAADVEGLYQQALAAHVIAADAKASALAANYDEDDVADDATAALGGGLFLAFHPTAATIARLRKAVQAARAENNRGDAAKVIVAEAAEIRAEAERACDTVLPSIRAACAVLGGQGRIPSPQQVHCQLVAQHAVAAKLLPDPVIRPGTPPIGTAMAGAAVAATEPASVLTFPANVSMVHHPAHGLNAAKNVTVRGTGNATLDAALTATPAGVNHYRLNASAGADAVFPRAFTGLAATLVDLPAGQCLVNHPGFGNTLGFVTLAATTGGHWDGTHQVLEIIDANTYRLQFTHANQNAAGTVGATNVTLADNGTDTVVTHNAHGRGLGPVMVTNASDPLLDGAHNVTRIIDANHYDTDKATAALVAGATGRIGGADVTMTADNTGCRVTQANHGRGLRMVTVQNAVNGAYDGAHNATRIDDDWAVIDFSAAASAKVAAQIGGTNITIYDKAAGVSLLIKGQAGGVWGGASVELRGSTNQLYDGPHTLGVVGGAAGVKTVPMTRGVLVKEAVRVEQPVTVIDHAGNNAIVQHGNHGLRGGPNVTIANATAGGLNNAHVATVLDSNYYALPAGDNTVRVEAVQSTVSRTALVLAGAAPAGIRRPGVTISGTAHAVLNGHHGTTEVVSRTQYRLAITTAGLLLAVAGQADTGGGLGPQAVTIDDNGIDSCLVTHALADHDLGVGTVTITTAHAYNGVKNVTRVIDDDTYVIGFTTNIAQNGINVTCNGRAATLDDDGLIECTITHVNPHERVVHQAVTSPGACPLAACHFQNLTRP